MIRTYTHYYYYFFFFFFFFLRDITISPLRNPGGYIKPNPQRTRFCPLLSPDQNTNRRTGCASGRRSGSELGALHGLRCSVGCPHEPALKIFHTRFCPQSTHLMVQAANEPGVQIDFTGCHPGHRELDGPMKKNGGKKDGGHGLAPAFSAPAQPAKVSATSLIAASA